MTDTGRPHSTQRALNAPNEAPRTRAQDENANPSDSALPALARISLLYESRDGKFCLFEDANGHLSAVRSARLA